MGKGLNGGGVGGVGVSEKNVVFACGKICIGYLKLRYKKMTLDFPLIWPQTHSDNLNNNFTTQQN